MERRIIFATGNPHKMQEIRSILSNVCMPIYSVKEAGVDLTIQETGATFEENALIKAHAAQQFFPGDVVLADDSGLQIDALFKAPGIYSSRFAGKDTPYSMKNLMLLKMLEDVPDERRGARFICVAAALFPDGTSMIARGMIEGRIAHTAVGENGFGYDPIFYVPRYGCTTAQMSAEQKNLVSHRGEALRKILQKLEEKYHQGEKDENGKR